MPLPNIFEKTSYKEFLKAVENSKSNAHRGFRSRIAEALDCQNAYISQIFNEKAQFSLEHAIVVSEFLKLKPNENEYFLLLVQYARAGTENLRNYFWRQIIKLREANLNLQNRVTKHKELSEEGESIYYSRWYYAAIHVLITIPKFQTRSAISSALKLPIEVVSEAVAFLSSWNLIVQKGDRLRPGPTLLHLGKDSAWLVKHHTNWRLHAVNAMTLSDPKSVHYSTVSSLSLHDFDRLRAKLVEVIADYVETVKPSKEEMLCCFALDFFNVLGRE